MFLDAVVFHYHWMRKRNLSTRGRTRSDWWSSSRASRRIEMIRPATMIRLRCVEIQGFTGVRARYTLSIIFGSGFELTIHTHNDGKTREQCMRTIRELQDCLEFSDSQYELAE